MQRKERKPRSSRARCGRRRRAMPPTEGLSGQRQPSPHLVSTLSRAWAFIQALLPFQTTNHRWLRAQSKPPRSASLALAGSGGLHPSLSLRGASRHHTPHPSRRRRKSRVTRPPASPPREPGRAHEAWDLPRGERRRRGRARCARGCPRVSAPACAGARA